MELNVTFEKDLSESGNLPMTLHLKRGKLTKELSRDSRYNIPSMRVFYSEFFNFHVDYNNNSERISPRTLLPWRQILDLFTQLC